jgi:hypothetical protein
MGVLRKKKLKHTVIQKYFFLEILINVKAGRVYHGRRVGQAWCSILYKGTVYDYLSVLFVGDGVKRRPRRISR